MIEERVKKVQRRIRRQGVDLLFIVDRSNTQYISGFNGTSSYILITPHEAFFLTDPRYIERVRQSLPDVFKVICFRNKPWQTIKKIVNQVNPEVIVFEEDLSYADYSQLLSIVREHERLMGAGKILQELRMIKDPQEIEAMRKACELTDEIFKRLLGFIQPRRSEKEICRQIKMFALELGVDELAFPPIVASGGGSAIPHYEPTDKKIEKGELLILDFGVKWDSYCSDMTRTLMIGKADAKVRRVYNTIRKAQQLGVNSLKPGVKAKEVDGRVRTFLAEKGYKREFLHNLGHGLGLQIHEPPLLSPQSSVRIKPGMLLTVEPGVYIRGFGGIRIEDTVLVKEDGAEPLTHSTKELIEI